MGFLKGFLNREGPKPPEATETQKPDKAKETKPAAEVARERIGKIGEAITARSESWRARKTKAKEWIKGKAAFVFLGTLGNVEKGIKAAPDLTKGAVKYTGETFVEGAQLTKKGVKAVGTEIAGGVESVKEAGKMAKEGFRGVGKEIKGGITKGKEAVVGQLQGEVRWFREKGDAVVEGFNNNLNRLMERGAEARDKVSKRISAKYDNFLNWKNREQILLAQNAEMRGKIENLEEKVNRLVSMIEGRSTLSEAKPDTRSTEERATDEFVEGTRSARGVGETLEGGSNEDAETTITEKTMAA